ncbi:hypothetical protein [Pseudomonas sp. Irchel 3E20]|uniref:hypothetical protein n=1 Tax=Pseudomonas sp. Irchel 3E20 TaxID=2008983 RepID=UPI000BA471E7|nr:hypothetical protein [Pseudomonas sp. Irchel 3E20]
MPTYNQQKFTNQATQVVQQVYWNDKLKFAGSPEVTIANWLNAQYGGVWKKEGSRRTHLQSGDESAVLYKP